MLEVYTDANYARSKINGRSTSRYRSFLNKSRDLEE